MFFILSILLTLVYIFMVWFDLDRTLSIWWSPLDSYTSQYVNKPLAREGYSTITKVIAIVPCNQGVCDMTLKSILDQSVKVDNIDIQTDFPDKFKSLINSVPTLEIKPPGVDKVGERDKGTVKIKMLNGTIYPYDYVEKVVRSYNKT